MRLVRHLLAALLVRPCLAASVLAQNEEPECEPCPELCTSGSGSSYCCWGIFDPEGDEEQLPAVSGSASYRRMIVEFLSNCTTFKCVHEKSATILGWAPSSGSGMFEPYVGAFCEPDPIGSAPDCALPPVLVWFTEDYDCEPEIHTVDAVGSTVIEGWALGVCTHRDSRVSSFGDGTVIETWESSYVGMCTSLTIRTKYTRILIKPECNPTGVVEESEFQLTVVPANAECCDPCNPKPVEEGGVRDPNEDTHDDLIIEGDDKTGGRTICNNDGGGGGSSGEGADCPMVVPPISCAPVLLAEGHKVESTTDLVVQVRGRGFVVNRYYTSNPAFAGSNLVGENWTITPFKFLREVPAGGSGIDVHLFLSAQHGKLVFKETSAGKWTAGGPATQYMEQATLTIGSTTYDTWKLVQPGEGAVHYFRDTPNTPAGHAGLLLWDEDEYGNSHYYVYGTLSGSTAIRLATVFLNGTTASNAAARVEFIWRSAYSFPVEQRGFLSRIEVYRPGSPSDVLTDAVDYWYYGDAGPTPDDVGTIGDLIQVVQSTLVDSAPAGVDPYVRRVTQYRYHDGTAPTGTGDERLEVNGADHQLKLVIAPEQVEFYAQQNGLGDALAAGIELLGKNDADSAGFVEGGNPVQVIGLAAKVIGYNTGGAHKRVNVQYLQTSCGCSGSPQGLKIEYAYHSGSGGDRSIKMAEYQEGGSGWTQFRTIYHDLQNTFGSTATNTYRIVTTATVEPPPGNRRWVRHYEYDPATRVLLRESTPAATDTYLSFEETGGPAWTPKTGPDSGLVYHYAYNGQNRRTHVRVSDGWDATGFDRKLVTRTTYSSTAGQEHLVTKLERFADAAAEADPVTSADKIETTTYDYGFHSGTKIAWVRTVVEAETVAENGPGGTFESFELYDETGLNRWSRAEDNALTYREFDPRTGALTKIVRNAARDGSEAVAPALNGGDYAGLNVSGWGRNSEGGSLTTTYERDAMGRVVRRTAPGGVSTYTIRELAIFPERPNHFYYAELTLPHRLASTTIFDGPARRVWIGAGDKVIGTVEYAVDGLAAYDPPTLVYTLGNVLSKSAAVHLLSGLVSATKRWPVVADSATEPVQITYTYDALGRIETVTAPNGTITRNAVYDVLNRVLEVEIGTDVVNNNFVTVAKYYYDHTGTESSPVQGMGNGNLTLIQQFTGETSTSGLMGPPVRTTVQTFDFRNRLQKIKNPGAPHEYVVYDNLDRVIERGLFGTEPSAIDSSGRGLYTRTHYSQRGLVYRKEIATNPDPLLTTGYLATNFWFDAAGRTVASWAPNSLGTKTVYDGLGRVVSVFTTDRGGDPAPGASGSHAAALSVSGDAVAEQQTFHYNDADRVDLVTTFRRPHDSTVTGELNSSNSVPTYVAYVYDDANRQIGMINYGTRDSSDRFASGTGAPTIPSSLPSFPYPADQIVTAVEYGVRGLVEQVVDPEGKRTRYVYDDLNRRVAVIENYDDADVEWDPVNASWVATGVGGGVSNTEEDGDRVTTFTYDGAGNVVLQTAHLIGGAQQNTKYVYSGPPTPGDPDTEDETLVCSNDLLTEVHYPDESTGQPGTTSQYKVRYAYNRLGELRSVTDQNGTQHVYVRDARGRVTRDWVNAFGADIDQAVKAIVVTYDSMGRLDQVRSASDTLGTSIVNDVRFRYTPLWQVARVYQDHNGPVQTVGDAPDGAPTGDTKFVLYGYTFSSEGNFRRPSVLLYPDTSSTLNYGYGSAGSVDFRASRVASMAVGAITLVTYKRVGRDMVSHVDYPTPDVQLDRTYDGAGNRRFGATNTGPQGVYQGWDRFGRVRRHTWLDGSTTTGSGGLPNQPPIVDTAHTYSPASNRLTAYDARPGALNGTAWQYDYDGLDRLKEARRGGWDGSMFELAVGGQQWALDMLGNWKFFRRDLNGDGVFNTTDEEEERTHNAANEILTRDEDGVGTDLPTLPFAYDHAGNMRQQDRTGNTRYTYTHDAWNRLVRVTLDQISPASSITLQENEYNGLHWRVVRKLDSSDVPDGLDQKRVMYYTPAWQMIQEDIDDDYITSPGIDRRAQQFWGVRYIDDAVARRMDADLDGVYENTWFYVTDAQFSVIAMLSSSGALVERVRYEPYGNARHHWPGDMDLDGDADTTDKNAIISAYGVIGSAAYKAEADLKRDGVVDATDRDLLIGHLALRSGALSDPNGPDSAVGYCGYLFNASTQLYTVRFRHYEPRLGRWIERDPIGYVDGGNLFQYLGSEPFSPDTYGLVSGTAHHVYPLYLGGADKVYPLACQADHQAAHDSIDEQLERFAKKHKIDQRWWQSKYSWHRSIWHKMSEEERKTVLRNSLEAANVEGDIDAIVEQSCIGATPGRKQKRGCSPRVITRSGKVVSGVTAAILLAISFENAGSETHAALRNEHCIKARNAMRRFAENGRCDELQNVKNDVAECLMDLGVAFEEVVDGNKIGVGVLHGIKTWDDLVDKCYINERQCCSQGSSGEH